VIDAKRELQIGDPFVETIANRGFITPQHGRGHPGRSDMLWRRRRVLQTKKARLIRPRLLRSEVQHLVVIMPVIMAVAKGTHCSRSDPALVGARKIWANTDQKEGVSAGTRNVEGSGKVRIALRA